MMASPPVAVQNRLLKALPPAIFAEIFPRLRPFPLPIRHTLIVPQVPIESVWFVESGWVSMVTTLDDGMQAEVGLVGREGMVGLPLIGAIDTAFSEAFVQGPGTSLQMDAVAFRHAMTEYPEVQVLMSRYAEAMNAQVTQTAACNGRHEVQPRLARWLLMAHDRADDDRLKITQEFLSLMLCVARPSVTIAAGIFQKAGIIKYGRGHIEILDRDALEASSCGCHRVVNVRFEYLLGKPNS